MTTTETGPANADEIAEVIGVPVGALAIRADQTEWRAEQKAALSFIGLQNAPIEQVDAFLHVCQRSRLDPWAKQIYLIERQGKWAVQTAIDGFRIIAERRPEYAGSGDILWCGEDGVWSDVWLGKGPQNKPHAARCSVHRHDRAEPITVTVMFAEFTAGQAKWNSSPAHMIGKCAEAGALRRAFPQDFSGLYISEELDHLSATRVRVPSERVTDSGPVDLGEVTGKRTAPAAGPPYPQRATAERTDRPAPERPADAAPAPDGGSQQRGASGGRKLTQAQSNKLHAIFGEARVTDRDARLRVVASLADRPIESSAELTSREAHDLINHLQDLGPDGVAALADAANKTAAAEQPQDGATS